VKRISFGNLRYLTKHDGGLTPQEVSEQRSRLGKNIIVEVAGNPWLALFTDTIKDPMIWFLVGIGSVFFLTGEIVDSITLFVAVIPLMFMDAILHWRTQASTSALKGQLASHVQVMRESRVTEIDSQELVPGDSVIINSGALLPADGVFKAAEDLQIDESSLTGESLPIKKVAAGYDPFKLSLMMNEVPVPAETIGYAGTRVLSGSGTFTVLFTGTKTSYGEIVQSVSQMPHQRTPLQKSIDQLVKVLVFSALALCLLLAGIRIYQGHGWLDALLSAATLAVAALPEEFPLVFTFFLGVGIFRLAQKRALVRQAVSVENIGRITQICTDKTGTITRGSLELSHLDPADGITEEILLQTALSAANSDSDSLDMAIHEVAKSKSLNTPTRLRTIPFTEDRKRETAFVELENSQVRVCIKGSPESVLAMTDLSPEDKKNWRNRISFWAKSGHKVIGSAWRDISKSDIDPEPEAGYTFSGLLAFEDPARPEVAEALAYCHQVGIRVLMITGDHPDTAAAIAKDAGLTLGTPRVLSAENEPERFREQWLLKNPDFIKEADVVARCTPLQKFWIVQSLKNSGEIVAVTGDGVNDVPALKAADVGIAMGERGTRSAREVSAIILGDDNFRTIVNAIREGRQLFKNLRKSFEYLLLIHIPLVSAAAIVPLIGYPLVFLPVHIVWLELVIHPTAILSFQSQVQDDKALQNRKSFFSAFEVFSICLVGLFVASLLGWYFLKEVDGGLAIEAVRAKSLALLTVWSASITTYLTRFRSAIANVLSGVTFLLAVFLIQGSAYFPFLKISPLGILDWAQVVAVVGLAVLMDWSLKKVFSQLETKLVS